MTREVSRENSQAAEDKDPNAVRPDVKTAPDEIGDIRRRIAEMEDEIKLLWLEVQHRER